MAAPKDKPAELKICAPMPESSVPSDAFVMVPLMAPPRCSAKLMPLVVPPLLTVTRVPPLVRTEQLTHVTPLYNWLMNGMPPARRIRPHVIRARGNVAERVDAVVRRRRRDDPAAWRDELKRQSGGEISVEGVGHGSSDRSGTSGKQ